MTRKVRFAALQYQMSRSKEENLATAGRLIEEAVNKYQPDLVGLPELCVTHYFPQYREVANFNLAEPIPGPTADHLGQLAKRFGIYIIAPLYEVVEPNIYFNSTPLIAPDGSIIGVYRKVHIPFLDRELAAGGQPGEEAAAQRVVAYEKFYYRGADYASLPVFQTKFGKIAVLTCWDSYFPEMWRLVQLKGAEVVYCPFASARPAQEHYKTLWVSTAMSYSWNFQCYSVWTNRVGREDRLTYRGRSLIVDPAGRVLAGPASETGEDICFAELDLDKIKPIRDAYPVLMNREPRVYAPLAEPHASRDAVFKGKAGVFGKVL